MQILSKKGRCTKANHNVNTNTQPQPSAINTKTFYICDQLIHHKQENWKSEMIFNDSRTLKLIIKNLKFFELFPDQLEATAWPKAWMNLSQPLRKPWKIRKCISIFFFLIVWITKKRFGYWEKLPVNQVWKWDHWWYLDPDCFHHLHLHHLDRDQEQNYQ